MHDLTLDDTTNVADHPEYSSRYTTKHVGGSDMTGFFVSDFLLSEIKTLRLKQKLNDTRTMLYDGLFEIPLFDDVMALAQSSYTATGRMIGIYPELKRPKFHNDIGFPMEDMLLDSLIKGGYDVIGPNVYNDLNSVVPVIIQCSDPRALIYLRSKTTLPLTQLLTTTTSIAWNNITVSGWASYAQAIGPEKSYFANSEYSVALNTVNLIRSYGMAFHPWTLRADTSIGTKFNDDFAKEEMYYYCCLGTYFFRIVCISSFFLLVFLGVEAMFTEFPDQTRQTISLMNNYKSMNLNSSSPCPISCENP
jgi:glycerophosphoryl diester phosphodiesterase